MRIEIALKAVERLAEGFIWIADDWGGGHTEVDLENGQGRGRIGLANTGVDGSRVLWVAPFRFGYVVEGAKNVERVQMGGVNEWKSGVRVFVVSPSRAARKNSWCLSLDAIELTSKPMKEKFVREHT